MKESNKQISADESGEQSGSSASNPTPTTSNATDRHEDHSGPSMSESVSTTGSSNVSSAASSLGSTSTLSNVPELPTVSTNVTTASSDVFSPPAPRGETSTSSNVPELPTVSTNGNPASSDVFSPPAPRGETSTTSNEPELPTVSTNGIQASSDVFSPPAPRGAISTSSLESKSTRVSSAGNSPASRVPISSRGSTSISSLEVQYAGVPTAVSTTPPSVSTPPTVHGVISASQPDSSLFHFRPPIIVVSRPAGLQPSISSSGRGNFVFGNSQEVSQTRQTGHPSVNNESREPGVSTLNVGDGQKNIEVVVSTVNTEKEENGLYFYDSESDGESTDSNMESESDISNDDKCDDDTSNSDTCNEGVYDKSDISIDSNSVTSSRIYTSCVVEDVQLNTIAYSPSLSIRVFRDEPMPGTSSDIRRYTPTGFGRSGTRDRNPILDVNQLNSIAYSPSLSSHAFRDEPMPPSSFDITRGTSPGLGRSGRGVKRERDAVPDDDEPVPGTSTGISSPDRCKRRRTTSPSNRQPDNVNQYLNTNPSNREPVPEPLDIVPARVQRSSTPFRKSRKRPHGPDPYDRDALYKIMKRELETQETDGPCPADCPCNFTLQVRPKRKDDRRFKVAVPLYKKLLKSRSLDPASQTQERCCERGCSCRWSAKRIEHVDLLADY